MNRIEIDSTVGPDGVLSITVPVGPREANRPVHVTIEPANGHGSSDDSNWRALVGSLYGSCSEFGLERPEQGRLEDRETIE